MTVPNYIQPQSIFRTCAMELALYEMSGANSGSKLAEKYYFTLNLTGGEDISSKVLFKTKIGFVINVDGAESTVFGKVVSKKNNIAKVRVRIEDYENLESDTFTFSKIYSEIYFREGDLTDSFKQTHEWCNESALIYSINPDVITVSSDTAHTVYNAVDYNFLIVQQYKHNDPNSKYETVNLRLKEQIEVNLGQIMFNYIDKLKDNELIKSLNWGFSPQMPLGLELQNNETRKQGKILNGDWAGFYVTVNCAFAKTYNCNFVIGNRVSSWNDNSIWNDNNIWSEINKWSDNFDWNDNELYAD
jgi:hypothetical protein